MPLRSSVNGIPYKAFARGAHLDSSKLSIIPNTECLIHKPASYDASAINILRPTEQ